jgi:hypothetical protein
MRENVYDYLEASKVDVVGDVDVSFTLTLENISKTRRRNAQFDNLMDFPGKLTNEGDEKEESNDEDSDEEESGEDEGDEDDNTQSSSKIHSQCKFDDNIAQNYIERSHIFGTEENNKKYYYNVLR